MKGDETMIDINETYYQDTLKKIAKFYSFGDDECSLETALHIAINGELNKIRKLEEERKKILCMC